MYLISAIVEPRGDSTKDISLFCLRGYTKIVEGGSMQSIILQLNTIGKLKHKIILEGS